MSLYAALKKPGPNGFGYASTAEEVTAGLDLSDRTYLLTGCNSGIGFETLRVLGMRGGYVVAAARREDKARQALAEAGVEGSPVRCELSDPASVRACVEEVRRLERPLDAIICNAGIMALPKPERRHGIELQLLTNHFGHFILVEGLVDRLADDGRVVVVSSTAHRQAPKEGIRFDDLAAERGYTAWGAYGQSKLANILFARQLARRLPGERVANALHPGVIDTNLSRHMHPALTAVASVVGSLFFKSIPQGAATQCYLAAHPDGGKTTGEYFVDCNVATPSRLARDEGLAEELWRVTERVVAEL